MVRELVGEELDPLETFLRDYYKEDIQQLAANYPNEKTLEIDYHDIERFDVDLADNITDRPDIFLPALKKAFDGRTTFDFPIPFELSEITFAILNARPNKSITELRSDDIGKYLSVTGMIEETTQVKPEIMKAEWECLRCGNIQQTQRVGDTINEPGDCTSCERNGPWKMVDGNTQVRDKQLIKIQTLPEENGGSTTDDLPVMAYNDLAGVVNPGDRVRVSGIYKMDTDNILNEQNPDAMRDTYIEAYGFEREQESFEDLETERKEEIQELSNDPDLFNKLKESFAPHILTDGYGDIIKLGIVLQLFGGVRRELPGGATRKGDINVLMVGEPGTGKSQFINTAKKIAPKGVKASGKGASAAGLTATAEKSELTGSWTLKAGALVQANNGFAGIDEFDKMDDGARKSMHEALEDQEIPINKAGMNVTLPAKCSVLAGANPKYGRYDRYEPLQEQVDLGPTLLSRFDLVFSLSDTPDEENDYAIALHQLKTDGDEDLEPAVDMELLREYIAFSKQNIEPSWPDGKARETIAEYYVNLRQEASQDSDSAPGPRMNDALRRYAEASARARHSEIVEQQDVERATELMDYHISQVALNENGEVDGDMFSGMKPMEQQKEEEYDQLKPVIVDAIGDSTLFPDEIAREINKTESKTKEYLDRMAERGEVVRDNGKFYVP